ncbi:helix-turn-helix domain-containing protein [Lacinutrix jangbogonensis]|uniref:helix-turn-helix domain-containing protein n=1 Tax=Lacinutrix jangbogonensis TaxID=1469557 RepID=UPI00053E71C1|nr:helix-turn-helix domain-containing protein [Lacinutrix jangbogonensis]
MIYNTYKSKDSLNLIEEVFELKIANSDLPFQSRVIPRGNHSIAYTFKGLHKITVGDKIYKAKNLIITGQTKKSYFLNIDQETECIGIIFHPTTLYKLTKLDVSTLNNKHLPLSEFSKALDNTLISFFNKMLSGENSLKALEELIKEQPLEINNHTENVDRALAIINQNGGQISINNLLEKIPVSQKTLETKFKQMVGLTPKKYARLYRFCLLIKKYNEKKLKFKDLVEMHNFHDSSHFTKEFKYFMNQSPKAYFKNESEFIKKYLK